MVSIPRRHPEPAVRQSTHIHRKTIAFPVKDLGGLQRLADEYESLVLGEITTELLVHYALKTLELFTHVNGLHTQEVLEVGM